MILNKLLLTFLVYCHCKSFLASLLVTASGLLSSCGCYIFQLVFRFSFCGSTIPALFECLSSFPFLTRGNVAAASLLASTNVLYWSADRYDSVNEVLSTL